MICVARDLLLGRRVAIKLAKHDEDPRALLAEAAAQAKFSHPYVLSVLDAGHDMDHCFVVVEYVDGVDASVASLNPNFSTEDARKIVLDAAQGLSALHDSGLVHGDVTPRNLMVGKDGRTRIIDFGLATRGRGTGAGTPGFFAPELPRTGATPQTDQYGLGRTLAALLRQSQGSNPALERVVRRATSPTPQRRYASVAALAHAMRHPGWRNALPTAAFAVLAIAVSPEGPKDLDSRYLELIETATKDLLGNGYDGTWRPLLHRAHAIAERTGKPEHRLTVAMLAARVALRDNDSGQRDLDLAAARLAQEVDDPSLRATALLNLATAYDEDAAAADLSLQLAKPIVDGLPADDPVRGLYAATLAYTRITDPTAPMPVVDGQYAPLVALATLMQNFGEQPDTAEHPQCDAIDGAYPQALCYTVVAAAHLGAEGTMIGITDSKPAFRSADLAVSLLEPLVAPDNCDLKFVLFLRGAATVVDDPARAAVDLARAAQPCPDALPEERVCIELLWALALLRSGAPAEAAAIEARLAGLELDQDNQYLARILRAELQGLPTPTVAQATER